MRPDQIFVLLLVLLLPIETGCYGDVDWRCFIADDDDDDELDKRLGTSATMDFEFNPQVNTIRCWSV